MKLWLKWLVILGTNAIWALTLLVLCGLVYLYNPEPIVGFAASMIWLADLFGQIIVIAVLFPTSEVKDV